MTLRIQMALYIRAEREIAEGRRMDAAHTIGELYDYESSTGEVSVRLYDLIKEVV